MKLVITLFVLFSLFSIAFSGSLEDSPIESTFESGESTIEEAAYNIPCTNQGAPGGCEVRVVACGTTNPNGTFVIGPYTDTFCSSNRIYLGEKCIFFFKLILYSTLFLKLFSFYFLANFFFE